MTKVETFEEWLAQDRSLSGLKGLQRRETVFEHADRFGTLFCLLKRRAPKREIAKHVALIRSFLQ